MSESDCRHCWKQIVVDQTTAKSNPTLRTDVFRSEHNLLLACPRQDLAFTSDAMPLCRHAFFFKQDFIGGYRYLDHCGEFLARAEQEKGMMPAGEQTPSGGMLENPEIGIKVEVNTLMLRLTHEFPAEDGKTVFLEHAEYFSHLYQKLFAPRAVERNGIAVQDFIPFEDVVLAERESLQGRVETTTALGQTLGMIPESRSREYRFASGSKNLRVKTHPATFERVQGILRNAVSRTTVRQQQVIGRQNNGVKRILEQSLKHALFVDLDLTEDNPPENGIRTLLDEVLEKQALVIKLLYPNAK